MYIRTPGGVTETQAHVYVRLQLGARIKGQRAALTREQHAHSDRQALKWRWILIRRNQNAHPAISPGERNIKQGIQQLQRRTQSFLRMLTQSKEFAVND